MRKHLPRISGQPFQQAVSMLSRKGSVAEKRRSNKVLQQPSRPNTFWLDTLCRQP
jgi:hypothetical protein